MKRILMTAVLAVAVIGNVACGGDPSFREVGETEATDKAALIQKFVGTWAVSGSSTARLETSEGPVQDTQPVSERYAVQQGVNSDLIFLIDHCSLPANVKGNVAVFERYDCIATDDGMSATFTVESGTATLAEDTIQFSAGGKLSITVEGQVIPGTWAWTYSMTKLSQ